MIDAALVKIAKWKAELYDETLNLSVKEKQQTRNRITAHITRIRKKVELANKDDTLEAINSHINPANTDIVNSPAK